MAAMLIYEHQLVSPHDLRRLNAAFFTMNGIISFVFFLAVAADLLFPKIAGRQQNAPRGAIPEGVFAAANRSMRMFLLISMHGTAMRSDWMPRSCDAVP